MRDTSHDVDDPDASMTDPNWHRSFIMSQMNAYPPAGVKTMMTAVNDRLVFMQGSFSQYALRMLMMPTMKGFWVPVRIDHGATLQLRFPELIGLKNCAEMVGGKIVIKSGKIRSFELVSITRIFELDIASSEQLLDLELLPTVVSTLTINFQQLKLNLKHIFYACSEHCTIKLPDIGGDKKLENVINQGLKRKASQMTATQALLRLQTDLIDHDLDEYSDI